MSNLSNVIGDGNDRLSAQFKTRRKEQAVNPQGTHVNGSGSGPWATASSTEVRGEPYTRRSITEVQRLVLQAVGSARSSCVAHEREDIAQDVMVRLLQVVQRDGVELELLSAGYIRRVARSVVVDSWRRKRCRPEDCVGDDFEAASQHPSPHEELSARRFSTYVERCINSLAPRRSQAVRLHLAGRSRAECSAYLGLSLKRTENLIYRGLGDLRRSLTYVGLGSTSAYPTQRNSASTASDDGISPASAAAA